VYGLVNQAIEDLVRSNQGDATWEVIKQRAGVQTEAFLGMEEYPDDVTYKLVQAAAEILNTHREEFLRAFGEYWVLYTAKKGYGEMLTAAGKNLQEFLQNLDTLHTRVGVIMPNLQPPSFGCTEVSDHSLNLHYYSHRQGLAPMVIGLVQGLGKMFGTETEVQHIKGHHTGDDHDVFYISWK
jgi:hypothetical protein